MPFFVVSGGVGFLVARFWLKQNPLQQSREVGTILVCLYAGFPTVITLLSMIYRDLWLLIFMVGIAALNLIWLVLIRKLPPQRPAPRTTVGGRPATTRLAQRAARSVMANGAATKSSPMTEAQSLKAFSDSVRASGTSDVKLNQMGVAATDLKKSAIYYLAALERRPGTKQYVDNVDFARRKGVDVDELLAICGFSPNDANAPTSFPFPTLTSRPVMSEESKRNAQALFEQAHSAPFRSPGQLELYLTALGSDPNSRIAWQEFGMLTAAAGRYDLADKCTEAVRVLDTGRFLNNASDLLGQTPLQAAPTPATRTEGTGQLPTPRSVSRPTTDQPRRPRSAKGIDYEAIDGVLSTLETEVKSGTLRDSSGTPLHVRRLRIREEGQFGRVVGWSYTGGDVDLDAARALVDLRIASLGVRTGPGAVTSDTDGGVLYFWDIKEIADDIASAPPAAKTAFQTVFSERPKTITNKLGVNWVAIVASDTLVTADNRAIKQWNIDTGSALREFSFKDYQLNSCAVSPNGTLLAGSFWDRSSDYRIFVWSTETGNEVLSLAQSAGEVAFSGQGNMLAAGTEEDGIQKLIFFSIPGKEVLFKLDTGYVPSLAFPSDDRSLAIGTNQPEVKLWDLEHRTTLRTLTGGRYSLYHVAISPDGSTVAGGASERDSPCAVFLWDTATGRVRHTLEGHIGSVTCVAFSPDGKLLATTGLDKAVKLWNPETGELIQILKGHEHYVRAVSFSSNGQALATGGERANYKGGEAKFWRRS